MISCAALRALQLVAAVIDRVTCCLKLNVIRVDAEVISRLLHWDAHVSTFPRRAFFTCRQAEADIQMLDDPLT